MCGGYKAKFMSLCCIEDYFPFYAAFVSSLILLVEFWTSVSVTGPECTWLLSNLACAQDDVGEQYADTESEKKSLLLPLEDAATSERNDRNLSGTINFPSDKTNVYHFVEEQRG